MYPALYTAAHSGSDAAVERSEDESNAAEQIEHSQTKDDVDSRRDLSLARTSELFNIPHTTIASATSETYALPIMQLDQMSDGKDDDSESVNERHRLISQPEGTLEETREPSAPRTHSSRSIMARLARKLWQEEHSLGKRILIALSLPLRPSFDLTMPETPSSLQYAEVGLTQSDTLQSEPVRAGASRRPGPWHVWQSNCWNDWAYLRASNLRKAAQIRKLCLQILFDPQLMSAVLTSPNPGEKALSTLFAGSVFAFLLSALVIIFCVPRLGTEGESRSCSIIIAAIEFAASLTWMYLTASSAVSLLMVLALILKVSNALLGATIFAIGQSTTDLVANLAVARRGLPVLAASATRGGPMMNLLLGIECGGLVQAMKGGNGDSKGVYNFQPAAGMLVSATCLLFALLVTLFYAFSQSWRLETGLELS